MCSQIKGLQQCCSSYYTDCMWTVKLRKDAGVNNSRFWWLKITTINTIAEFNVLHSHPMLQSLVKHCANGKQLVVCIILWSLYIKPSKMRIITTFIFQQLFQVINVMASYLTSEYMPQSSSPVALHPVSFWLSCLLSICHKVVCWRNETDRNARSGSEPAMSNPWAACGPVEGFVWPSLGFCCSKSILYTGNLSLLW